MAELYSAAYHGSVPALKELLEKGADVAWRHPTGGATALYVACEFGHVEAARLLIDAGAPVDAARDDGATPLYKACQDGGKPEIARMLAKAGAQVNKTDAAGMTPLWLAVHQGSAKLVGVLLDAGADPLHRVQGWSALDLARREGHGEISTLLMAKLPESERNRPSPGEQEQTKAQATAAVSKGPVSKGPDPQQLLYSAAHHGDTGDLRKMLVADGVDVNCYGERWTSTALHVAAYQVKI